MTNMDTIELLKECSSGIEMAVYSIDEIVERVENRQFKELLKKARREHVEFGEEVGNMLHSHNYERKEPGMMAKGMAWMETNVKLSADYVDKAAADIMVSGCDMGVKKLYKYLNQYGGADEQSRTITKKVIDLEENLEKDLRKYL